uniref:T9SS type A sorting domain-containing protein n=1 Tax=Roseihalotalea indica TaxID=2867963 RepID=A0AA49JE56_9BACT|nr:T9SS type A sorting domain-containing protein [Tunicatimonas sp. TK19036]
MKKAYGLLFIVAILLLSVPSWAQNTSKNNYTGTWTNNSSWLDNSAPTNNGGYNPDITIQGYITRNGNLRIDNGTRLIVNDTLWIKGDFTLTGGGTLILGSNGLLIVSGNTNASGGSTIDLNGLFVALQNVNIANGINVDPNGAEPYVFGTTTYAGTNYSGYVPGESALQNNRPDLYAQIMNGTLPIELLFFSASATSNSVALLWTTAMEENFDFFTVERAGADLQFKALGTLKGQGFSNAPVDYQFSDKAPLQGVNYYRLKATDLDGTVEYHKIISAWFEGPTSIQLYPNPVENYQFTIAGSATHLKIMNLMGDVILAQPLTESTQTVDLPQQTKAGSYIAVFIHADGLQEKHSLIVR